MNSKKAVLLTFTAMLALLGLAGCGAQNTSSPANQTATSVATVSTDSSSQSPQAYMHLTVVGSGVELGSDGKTHDVFLPGNFTLKKGVPTQIEIANYDEGPHTLTVPELNIDIQIPGHTNDNVASITKVIVTAGKTGTFEWSCDLPCDGKADGWAMGQEGYMRGKVTVVDDQKLYDYVTIVGSGVEVGSDGKTHDAFLPGNFTFKQGKHYVLEFANFDEGPHTFTVGELNINYTIPGHKSDNVASVTKFEFTPDKTGTFEWSCNLPCDGKADGWAMGQEGFMRGKVTVEK